MSIQVMAQVWTAPLPPRLKLVALAIADHADDAGLCWPAIATLCRKTGQSERTVQSAIRELEEGGALLRHKRPHQSTVYTIQPGNFRTPQELPLTPAISAGNDRQELPIPPAESAPRIINESSKVIATEPSAPREKPAAHKNGAARIDFDGLKFNGIDDAEALHWQQECYPAVSVPDQVARAAEWLKANPKNRKSNYRRFLTNWLARAQDRARPK